MAPATGAVRRAPRGMSLLMDPLTQALALLNTIAQIDLLLMQGMTATDRAKYDEIRLARMQRWEDFIEKLHPHSSTS
jgi:hypothetical protein